MRTVLRRFWLIHWKTEQCHWYSTLISPSLTFLPIIPLPYRVSSLSVSSFLEEKPQAGSGFIPSWRPQTPPIAETLSPSPLSPSSAHVLFGSPPPLLPLPSQPYKSQTATTANSDAGTESKRNHAEWLKPTNCLPLLLLTWEYLITL